MSEFSQKVIIGKRCLHICWSAMSWRWGFYGAGSRQPRPLRKQRSAGQAIATTASPPGPPSGLRSSCRLCHRLPPRGRTHLVKFPAPLLVTSASKSFLPLFPRFGAGAVDSVKLIYLESKAIIAEERSGSPKRFGKYLDLSLWLLSPKGFGTDSELTWLSKGLYSIYS